MFCINLHCFVTVMYLTSYVVVCFRPIFMFGNSWAFYFVLQVIVNYSFLECNIVWLIVCFYEHTECFYVTFCFVNNATQLFVVSDDSSYCAVLFLYVLFCLKKIIPPKFCLLCVGL